MLQSLALAFVGIIFTAGLVRPEIALAVLLSMFPLEQLVQANSPFFVTQSSLFNIMCGCLAVVALMGHLARRPDGLAGAINPTSIFIVSLFCFGALSVLWSLNPLWAAEIVRNGTPYAIVLILMAPLLVYDMPESVRLMKAVMVIGIMIAAQLMLNPNLELYTSRLVLGLNATQKSNPLAIGTLGGTLFVIGMMTNFSQQRFWTLVRAAAVFSGLGLALLSGSRGQVMAAIIVVVCMYPMSRRIPDIKRFATTVIGFVVVAAVAYAAMKFFIGRDNEERWSSESLLYGGSGRLENAVDLIAAYLSRPQSYLTGLGYYSFEVIPNRGGDGYSHVMLADALGELGIVGLILYVGAFSTAGICAYKLFQRFREDPIERGFVATLSALLAYAFLLQNKQGTLFGIDQGWVYALILARLEYRTRDRVALIASDPEWVSVDSFEDGADGPHTDSDDPRALPAGYGYAYGSSNRTGDA
ncbi:MAG: hypothetical protein JNM94_18120 [Phycisphaerae bacterium]|nr:hypothetical protein [Phycisphaerae bacterium]